jgi:hypothetical protein
MLVVGNGVLSSDRLMNATSGGGEWCSQPKGQSEYFTRKIFIFCIQHILNYPSK